jgi:hypothetical protein
MRSWAGVAGLIVLLGLVVIGTPLWTNYASATPGVASAITAGLGLVVAILVLVVLAPSQHFGAPREPTTCLACGLDGADAFAQNGR